MRLGYVRSAETYFKHMVATEPILAMAWGLGAAGLAIPFFCRNKRAKDQELAKATTKIVPPPNLH